MRALPLALAVLAGTALAESYTPPALVRVRAGADRAEAMRAVIEAGGQVVTRHREYFEATLPQDVAMAGGQALGLGPEMLELLDQDLDRQLDRFAGRDDAGDYHTVAEVEAELAALVEAHPELIRTEVIGTTGEGRPIRAARISSRDDAAGVPAVLVCGMHHAREWIAVEVPMGLIHDLVTRHADDPATQALLASREVWVVPVLNPDGLQYSQTERRMWRKNRRPNDGGSFGVDLNRNWGFRWGGLGASPSPSSDTYRGPEAFSEPELQALRDLARREGVKASLSFHSYGELVMWPWSYDHDIAPDVDELSALAREMAALNGYTPQQSASLYPSSGDFDDWFYGELGATSFTIELGTQFVPPESQIPTIVAANVAATRHFLEHGPNALPMFRHEPPAAQTNPDGPYPVVFDLSPRFRADPPFELATLHYTTASGATGATTAVAGEAGAYAAAIPGAGYGSVAYHLEVTGPAGPGSRFPADGEFGFSVVDSLTLLVDDDGGKGHEVAYREALDALGAAYRVVPSEGLTVQEMLSARNVIWSCGDDSATSLTVPERELLTAYFEAGGELLLFGQDIAYATQGTPFLKDTLRARFVKDTVHSKQLAGAPGSFLADLSVTINDGDGVRQRYPDGLAPEAGGTAVLAYQGQPESAGVAVEDGYKVALFGFGLEGIDGATARRDFLAAGLAWLDVQGAGVRAPQRTRLYRLPPK